MIPSPEYYSDKYTYHGCEFGISQQAPNGIYWCGHEPARGHPFSTNPGVIQGFVIISPVNGITT